VAAGARLMRLIYWIALLGVAIILAVFAVSNREAASLALWPLPFVVGLPLYLMVFAAVLAGFLIGVLTAWVGGARRRGELRRCRRRNEALTRELAATQAKLNLSPADAADRGAGIGGTSPPASAPPALRRAQFTDPNVGRETF
jgi:lipopolysaccharide assembly protein A